MKGLRLAKEMRVKWNGQNYKIESRLNSGLLQMRNTLTNECRVISEQELLENYAEGNLSLLGSKSELVDLQAELERKRVHDFTALEENEKAEVRRKFAYVQAVLDSNTNSLNDEFLLNLIAKVSQQLNDKNLPCSRTLRRWYNSYIKSSEDVRSLASAHRAKGNRNRKLGNNCEQCETILTFIDTAIAEEYLNQQRNPVEAIYNKVEVEIHRLNAHRSEADQLPVPAKSSIYEIVTQLDQYEVDKARHGSKYAEAKHRVYQQAERPKRPLERVECDDTKIDLLVVDSEKYLPLGRPWLFVMICVYTKMILGYFLSFYPPSYTSVMLCLRHAVQPKTYVREKYPHVNNTWDSFGMMEILVVDNARQWYTRHLDDACLQLGINVQYSPVRMPWYKSSVERFFGTLNRQFLHRQPGTTFSNVFDRGDYDPSIHAVITLDELEELLHKWIVDVYSQSEHRGVRNVPARLWKIGISKYPPALPASVEDLNVLLGKIEFRKIGKLGIVRHHLFYNSDILVKLRSSCKHKDKVKIKYDPIDLGMIHVYDNFHGCWIPVPALDQDYASGLTEWQHKVITKFARKNVRDSIDLAALAETKDYIQTRIKELIFNGRKRQKAKVKAARWLTTADPAEPRLVILGKSETKKDAGNKSNSNLNSTASMNAISDERQDYEEDESDSMSFQESNDTSKWLDTAGWNGNYDMPE